MYFSGRNLCFLDLETTGFSPEKDSIIEVAFVIQDQSGNELDRYEKVTLPDKSELSAFVSDLTGITQAEIDTTGVPFADIAEEIRGKIGDAVIIGHNIDFDIRFLTANGVDVSENGRIDTHELSRILLINEESYALEVLSRKYGFAHENAHRAMSDVEVCVDMYPFFLEKIAGIPAGFVDEIREFLENQTDWLARDLFLQSAATGSHAPVYKGSPEPEKKNAGKSADFLDIDRAKIFTAAKAKPQAIRAGTIPKTTELQSTLADQSEGKTIIVTNRFQDFSQFEIVPLPEILLDPKRLNLFATQSQNLDDRLSSFYLQAKFRGFLGYRGKNFFNLFFDQDELWAQICMQSVDQPEFKLILKEKSSANVLVVSHGAFLRLIDQPLFSQRTLIVDEIEDFGEKILFAPSEEVSLFPWLDDRDNATSSQMQFWISGFCQEVIKPTLGHELSPFPTRMLLPEEKSFPEFAASLENFSDEKLKPLQEWLKNPRKKLTRWLTYYPKTGNLVFGAWHPDDWRELKTKISEWPQVFFYRHEPGEALGFFRIFSGISAVDFHNFPRIFSEKQWEVPENLISSKSPDFNDFCANKIAEIAKESVAEDHWVLGFFSSLETLRKVYENTIPQLPSDVGFYGERTSGGRGKIIQLLKKHKKNVLFFQKMNRAELRTQPWKTLVLQKFPFPAPHPLTEKIESVMKASQQSFWDVWTVPKVAANLSQKTANFPSVEKIVCLDGRENASWGKTILQGAFPEIFSKK